MSSTARTQPALEVVARDGASAIWATLRREAMDAALQEPTLASFLHACVLNHATLSDALAYNLAQKLGGLDLNALQVRAVCADAYQADPMLVAMAEADLLAVRSRDPACKTYLQPLLYFKGFSAIQAHRVAHALWRSGRELLAMHIQSRVSELFQVDIHPAARIGSGIMIDHATGVVIGETAVVGNDVSLLHSVTLGGTGKAGGDRHPKIGNGVLIGAGAKVLGNIRVGDGARIASGSVVLHEVPSRCTVAGVPAKAVGGCCEKPSESMDQMFDIASFDPGL
jgi:serine O-acetyltransferase